MKLLLGTLILGVTASAFVQEVPTAPTPPTPPTAPRVAVMPAIAGDVIVAGVTKNAPFTADESGETVRVMSDGNRIVESWTGTIARNSQGRTRREVTSGTAGSARPFIFSGGFEGHSVVTLGSGEVRHVAMAKIDAELTAARAGGIAPQAGGSGISVVTTGENVDETKHVMLARVEAARAAEGAVRVIGDAEVVRATAPSPAEEGKVVTRKESLGTRDFGGVQAEGTRITNTFAPGAVGNDREIEVTREVWFSKDLGVIVYSKRTDPRTGEQTYQMTNINRTEPDPSLFPGK